MATPSGLSPRFPLCFCAAALRAPRLRRPLRRALPGRDPRDVCALGSILRHGLDYSLPHQRLLRSPVRRSPARSRPGHYRARAPEIHAYYCAQYTGTVLRNARETSTRISQYRGSWVPWARGSKISRVVSSGSPWTWGAAAQAAIQKVLKLRYTLMPTLIAAGRRAAGLGNIDVYMIRRF